MTTKTAPCPVCGKPVVHGYEHVECTKADTSQMGIVHGDTIVFSAGTNLDDLLAGLLGQKPLYFRGEQFDWKSHDGKTEIAIDVTSLQRAIATGRIKYEKLLANIDEGYAHSMVTNGSVEREYLEKYPMEKINEPIIIVKVSAGDDTSVVVDGMHRYFIKYCMGATEIRAYMVEFADWQPYGQITLTP